ncbi:MAG: hypothetical protein R2932_18285 [Caldilineaceae bacterium]
MLTTRFAPDIALADGAATAASAEQQLLTGDLTTLSVELLFDLRTAATGALAVAVQEAMAGQLGLAEPIALVDETGQPRLQLLGYQLQPNAEKADVTVSLYFATVAPLDEDYGIWFHTFVEGQEKRTFDHDPVLPTTRWPPGLIYRDQFTISVPPGTYRLETGLWHAESDRRLLPPTGDFGVTFGTVVVP